MLVTEEQKTGGNAVELNGTYKAREEASLKEN